MKHMLLLASCLAAAAAVGAEIGLESLPDAGCADTETATNVPFAFARSGVRNFEFELCLAGTPSNNVQLAFGRDADSDGVLSTDETDMAVGWDCGEWRIVNFTNGSVFASVPMTTNLVKKLRWDLRVRRGRPRRLELSENGVVVFQECAESPEQWFYSPEWNFMRLTVRGVDVAQESARVKLNVVGYVMDLR